MKLNFKVSIITVCYNCREDLLSTLESVVTQDYHNKEVIVIDGGSTDGTVDLLNSLKVRHHLQFVSERDSGIYDAMNKGVQRASGDFIVFMNAGDKFASSEVIQNMMTFAANKTNGERSILYGDTLFLYPEGFLRLQRPRHIDLIWMGMPFCHQSTFTSRDIFRQKLFDLRFKIAADLEFFNYSRENNVRFFYNELAVSVFSVDGKSDKERFKGLIEEIKVLRRYHQLRLEILYFFLSRRLPWIIQGKIKQLLPGRVVRAILAVKYLNKDLSGHRV